MARSEHESPVRAAVVIMPNGSECPAELTAGVLALSHRVTTGYRNEVAEPDNPADLER